MIKCNYNSNSRSRTNEENRTFFHKSNFAVKSQENATAVTFQENATANCNLTLIPLWLQVQKHLEFVIR